MGGGLEKLSPLAAEDADGRQAAHPRGHQWRRQGRQVHGLRGRSPESDRLRVLERRSPRRPAAKPRLPEGYKRRRQVRHQGDRAARVRLGRHPSRDQQLHLRWGRRAVFSGRRLSPHIGRVAVGTGHAPERRRRLPVRAANLEIRDLRALQFPEPAWPRLRPVEPGHRVRCDRWSAVLRAIVLDQEVLPRDGDQAGAEARRRQDPADRRRGAALEPALPRGDAGQSHRAQHDRVQRAAELQDQRRWRRPEDHRGRADSELGRRELPAGGCRGRSRRSPLLHRLAQPDRRAHAAQPARHDARSPPRSRLSSHLSGPAPAQTRSDRWRTQFRSCWTSSRSRKTASAIAPRSS